MSRRIILSILIFLLTAILVPVLHGMLGLSLDRIAGNHFAWNPGLCRAFGAIFTGAGVLFLFGSVLQMILIGRGFPISPLPPSKLVTDGLYSLSRHPIYFGASLTFLGAALLFPSFWMTILCWPMYTLFFAAYARMVEEPVLEARFGEEYIQYRTRVPLIYPIPKIRWLVKSSISMANGLNAWVNHPTILSFRCRDTTYFLEYGIIASTGLVAGMLVFVTLLLLLNPNTIEAVADIAVVALIAARSFFIFAAAFTSAAHGKTTDSEVCVIYAHDAHRTAKKSSMLHRPLFPVQVWSAVSDLLIVQLLLLLWSTSILPYGYPLILAAVAYNWIRFSEDWFHYHRLLAIGPLSWQQIFNIVIIVAGTIYMFWYPVDYGSSYARLLDYYPRPDLTWITLGAALLAWLLAIPVFSYTRPDLEPELPD